MRTTILIILLTFTYSTAVPNPSNVIKKIEQKNTQKNIFNEQKKNIQNLKENKTYKMKKIEINEDKVESSCIEIEEINIKGSSIFDASDFKDLLKPYLNNCNGLKNLSNLVQKISNLYIEKGYVTSRAYLKAQDLSNGSIDIDILEGKVEDIIGKNIFTKNIYQNTSLLNMRDLEVAIQQAERLRSQSINFKLKPGSKVGYTNVNINAKHTNNPYYGDISMNNYGGENTGKYQLGLSFNYENLLSLSDIISLRVNSTNRALKENNKTLDTSISYSFPIQRALFDLSYSRSKYKLINYDEFTNVYSSKGLSSNANLGLTYSLFHTKEISSKILTGLNYKSSDNYLNGVKLDIQSYKLLIAKLGLSFSYKNKNYNSFNSIEIYRGLDQLGATNNFADQEIEFTKYILNLGLTRYFHDKNNFKYDFSFRGQYSKDYLYATEEISVGGPYSVRGFKDASISGNKGFYLRNELSFSKELNTYSFSPYLALDYGYIFKGLENNPGKIIGSAIGIRTNAFNKVSAEVFYSKALKDSPYTKEYSKNFLGFNLAYSF